MLRISLTLKIIFSGRGFTISIILYIMKLYRVIRNIPCLCPNKEQNLSHLNFSELYLPVVNKEEKYRKRSSGTKHIVMPLISGSIGRLTW